MRVDLLGETDRFLDRLGRLGRLAGEADDKGAVDGDAEIAAVFGELAGPVDPDTFLDVDENLLVPGLVSDEQEAQAIVPQAARLGGRAGAGSSGHVCRMPPGYVGWMLEPIRACRHPAEDGA
jgi:hypothetical protein